MKDVVDEIAKTSKILPQIINARLVLLDAQSNQIVEAFVEEFVGIASRGRRQPEGGSPHLHLNEIGDYQKWTVELDNAMSQARLSKHPLLLAQAIAIRLKCYVGIAINSVAITGNRIDAKRAGMDWLPESALSCIGIFEQAGDLRWACKIKILLADFYVACDDQVHTEALAKEVLPIADAFEYKQEAQGAREHLEKRSTLVQLRERIANPPSEDEIALRQSDEETRKMALRFLRVNKWPLDRLANFEKDCFIGKYIAKERLQWCRHIEVWQDEGHLESAAGPYSIDPDRFGYCTKFAHESTDGSANYQNVIQAFKDKYCLNCAPREPGRGAGLG